MINEKEILQLMKDSSEFRGRFDQFMDDTDRYRRELCRKIEEIKKELKSLPCETHSSLKTQVKVQWAVIFVLVLGGFLFSSTLQRNITRAEDVYERIRIIDEKQREQSGEGVFHGRSSPGDR